MATQFPIRDIRGLPREAQADIYRDLQYLAKAIDGAGATTGFDAMVDPTATSNDTTKLIFTTPFAAINYLYNTKLLRSMSIGVVSRDGATMTETASISAITNASIRLGVVGWQDRSSGGSHTVSWNLAGFTFAGSGTAFNVSGLTLKGGATGVFTFQNTNFRAWSCQVGDGLTQRWHASGAYYDCVYNGTADGTFVECVCAFTAGITSGTNTSFVMIGGSLNTAGSSNTSISLPTDNIYVANVGGNGSSSGSQAPITYAMPSAKSVTWIMPADGAEGSGLATVPPALNITSTTLRKCYIDGQFAGLVVPTLTAASSQTGTSTVRADIVGYTTGTYTFGVDIAGPANITLNIASGIMAAGGGLIVLRGNAIAGTINFVNTETAGAVTLLKAIGLKRSTLMVATKRDTGSASTGTKPFDIDAASTNNVIIFENDGFGTAGANASASTLIITDAGVPSAPSGAAGGSLASTYPNPTFAGRFPSVAELDKDFTKHFMLGGMQR